MFQHIIFDLDLTLCHPVEDFNVIFERSFGYSIEAVEPIWYEHIVKQGANSGIETIRACFPKLSDEVLEDSFLQFSKNWSQNQRLFDGVLTVLERFKNYYDCKLGIMTNGPSKFQHDVVDVLGIREYVDFVYASGDEKIGIRKPSTKLIQLLENLQNIDAKKALFIGDGLDKDVMPARACGWYGVKVNPTNEFLEPLSFEQFEIMIKKEENVTLNWSQLSI